MDTSSKYADIVEAGLRKTRKKKIATTEGMNPSWAKQGGGPGADIEAMLGGPMKKKKKKGY